MSPGSVADRLGRAVAPWAGSAWLRLCRATLRLRWEGRESALPDDGGPVIYAFWHHQLAMMPWVQLRPPSVVAISRSRDGEFTARLFAGLDVEAVRGSSTRGGAGAFKGLVRAVRQGRDLAITPDGPQGPSRVAKSGATRLARLTGRPLLPVAFVCRPRIRLGTWDRLVLPVPFGRGLFAYGELLWVAPEADAEACEAAALEIGRRLDDLSERAASRLTAPCW